MVSSLLLRSRKNLMQEKKDETEFCGLYRHLEDPDGIQTMNANMFKKLFHSFTLIIFLCLVVCADLGFLLYPENEGSRERVCLQTSMSPVCLHYKKLITKM